MHEPRMVKSRQGSMDGSESGRGRAAAGAPSAPAPKTAVSWLEDKQQQQQPRTSGAGQLRQRSP
eukprot:scaffold267450_cov17-Tisochrysis_lutea.AAC.1